MSKREIFPSPADFPNEREKKAGFRLPPHTEESKEEKERLNQEDDLRRFLKVEDIPDWFTDTGEEREEEKSPEETKWEEMVDDFKTLSVAVQQELLEDMQRKMKRKFFKTKAEMVEHFRYLVDKNLEVMRREERGRRQRK